MRKKLGKPLSSQKRHKLRVIRISEIVFTGVGCGGNDVFNKPVV